MRFPTLAVFTLLGSAVASKTPIPPQRRQQDQVSTIQTRIADVAGIETAIATASGEVTVFSDAVAAFDGTTPENSLAFLTSFSRLGISVNSVSQTVLVSGLLNVADSAAVYPDVALFTTSLSRAVGGVQAKSAPITASGFGGVVCASLESLLVEVELLLETVEAVCKSKSPYGPGAYKLGEDVMLTRAGTVDISYENLIGVLADQVDTQFEVAIGAFCLA